MAGRRGLGGIGWGGVGEGEVWAIAEGWRRGGTEQGEGAEGGRREPEGVITFGERECCLLVLNLVSSTLPCILN
jgi:hypothetical protein